MQTAQLALETGQTCSVLWHAPRAARACYVMAHGAGAGMAHPFMSMVAEGLVARGIATYRFNFPYMERNSKRPDSPAVAQAAVRAAVQHAGRLMPGLALVAGGKSFGGRMSSEAQARTPLPSVRGLAFLGFPLHPAGKPGVARAEHLAALKVPLLFIQGTRDTLADESMLGSVVERLGASAKLCLLEQADHSFRVPARSGLKQDDVNRQLIDSLAEWIDALVR